MYKQNRCHEFWWQMSRIDSFAPSLKNLSKCEQSAFSVRGKSSVMKSDLHLS